MIRYAVSIEICRVKTREDADALAKYMAELVGDFPDAYVCVSEYQETPKSIIASFRPPKTLEQRNLPMREALEGSPCPYPVIEDKTVSGLHQGGQPNRAI